MILKNVINGLKIGLTVSTILVLIYLITAEHFQWRYVFITMLFSFTISMFVTLTISMVDHIRNVYQPTNFYLIWSLYYLASMIGMVIASETCFYVLRVWIQGKPYVLFSEPRQLMINLVISLVVTTIIGAYQSQRTNLEYRLKQKELDIVKLKQSKTLAELQALQSRINPHFLYNSLNSIASLIHEDKYKAEEMTLKLSKLFRYSINTQNENLSAVKEEIEIVKTYLDIEKVRFGDRIKFIIDVKDSVENNRIPRFILQPLVENALKHGLADSVEGGKISIKIEKDADHIILSVADNGIPFPDELEIGYGLQSTYEKLNLIYGDKYQLHITNQPFKQITIKLPV